MMEGSLDSAAVSLLLLGLFVGFIWAVAVLAVDTSRLTEETEKRSMRTVHFIFGSLVTFISMHILILGFKTVYYNWPY